MQLEAEFLADAFGAIEKENVAVHKVTIGVAAQIPEFLISDNRLWGAEIERTPRWTRIVSLTATSGTSHYYRLDPEMQAPNNAVRSSESA